MSLEAMVGGALRDMTTNDCQYVIGKLDSSGSFDCGFVPRFFIAIDSDSYYFSFSFFPIEGNNLSYYHYSDRTKSYTFTLSGTVLKFDGIFENIIAFK